MRPDRRLRRERRALARRRQHRRLQLPLRRRVRPEALVGARVRARDRRQSGREPVRPGRPRPSARGSRLPRPIALPAGDGGRAAACSCAAFAVGRLAVGRTLERLARLPALLRDRRLMDVVPLRNARPARGRADRGRAVGAARAAPVQPRGAGQVPARPALGRDPVRLVAAGRLGGVGARGRSGRAHVPAPKAGRGRRRAASPSARSPTGSAVACQLQWRVGVRTAKAIAPCRCEA